MIVVDTNLLAYFLIEGDQTESCRHVFTRDPEWCAPFLWRSEFRNVLVNHMQHTGMSLESAKARMAQAEELLGGREYALSSGLILELASANGISAYDAEIVGLAKQLETALVTTDKPLLRKFSDIATNPKDFNPD